MVGPAHIFWCARFSPLGEFAPSALAMVTFIGAGTAIFAATIGLTQFDIKQVKVRPARSWATCSSPAASGAYSAGVFRPVTRTPSSRRCCSSGAGSVAIHAMSGEQDVRKMGGIWSKVKVTYVVMWIRTLALVGFPGFAGFFRKDAVLEAAWAFHNDFHYWLLDGQSSTVSGTFYWGRACFG